MKHARSALNEALSMFDQSILFYSFKPLTEVLGPDFPTEVIDLYD